MPFRKTLTFIIFLFASAALLASSQPSFTRLESGDMVFSLFQDSRGMVWAGTQYGTASFNGDSFVHKVFYQSQVEARDMRVNCSFPDGPEAFYIGTSYGLYHLDIRTMQAEKTECVENRDVRSIFPIPDDRYLICASTGLFILDNASKLLQTAGIDAMCYDCVQLDSKSVLVCSYLGAYFFDTDSFTSTKLDKLPALSDGVLSAVVDDKRACAWLGTNGMLYRYDLASGACDLMSLPDNTYKSLLLDSSGLLLCGTENGLVIYNPDSGQFSTERHKSKDYSTLTGNVIWSLMEDDCRNIWVGTNKGVSVWQRNSPVTIYDWDILTGTEEENNLFCIATDKSGCLWAGGDAGASVFSEPDAGRFVAWYRTDSRQYHLTKNTVRHITLDDDGDLWLATDDGINLLDRENGEFRNYILWDEDGKSSAHWVYDIEDDHNGNLWTASYEGGVFIADKQSLKSSPSGLYRAERVLSVSSGDLRDNTVGKISSGSGSDMWALMTNLGLLRYDTDDASSTLFPPEYFSSTSPLRNLLVLGKDVWVGTFGGLYCLDSESLEYRYFPMPKMAYANPIAEKDNNLWVIDGESLVAIDLESFGTEELCLGSTGFSCGTLWHDGSLVLGGRGKLAVVSAQTHRDTLTDVRLFISDFRFNGVSADIHGNPDYLDLFVVPYGKDLEIEVCAGYFHNGFNNVEYSISGMNSWTRLNRSSQIISFAGLRPGNHCLKFRSTVDGSILKKLNIRIMSAWYLRWYMFIIYAALIFFSVLLLKKLAITREYLKKKQQQLENIRRMTAADETVTSPDKAFMDKLNSYIEVNLSNENLSVNDIAAQLRIPPKQLYRKVKSITGFSVVEYVRNTRLQKAASLLKTGAMSISEVMYHVGFSNLSYFTKCFKELFGMGPKSYLEK